jgi:hypothetical protein
MSPGFQRPPGSAARPEQRDQPDPAFAHDGDVTVAMVLLPSAEYSAGHVDRLVRQVRRHSRRALRFVCLTTEPQSAFREDVEAIALHHPETLTTKYAKIELFRPDLDLGRVFYSDLDNLIIGDLEPLLAYDGLFCMSRQLGGSRSHRHAGSVLAWAPGFGHEIYEAFRRAPEAAKAAYPLGFGAGDQLFMADHAPRRQHVFQDWWPESVVSFKYWARQGQSLPAAARIVSFHGQPKPDAVPLPWVQAALDPA